MDPELSAIIMTILIYTALSATLIICYAGVLYFWKKKLIRTNSQIERDILDNSLQEDSLSGKIEKVYKRENELNEPLLPENLYSKKDGLTLSNLIKDLTVLGSGSVSKHQKAPEESQRVTFSSDGKGKASTFQKAFHKYKLNRIKEAKKENNFYKLKGFWAFIKGIFLINDKVMSNACSNDAYIYLLYLKWCAMSLFFLSLIGVLLLCPFYYFSSDHENKTFLMNITIIGITKSVPRMWMVFAISIAYSILGYAIVFKFVLNFQEFIYYKEENSKQSEDYKISKRTIMILNLPDYCSVYECNRTLHSFFKNRPDYMSVSTLGCYHPLYQILRDRIKIVSKLINAKSNPKTKQSKIEKLENQRNQKNYEAERALKNGISHNEGIAFVQFSTAKAANDFINNFFSLKRKYSYIQKYEKDQFSDIDYDALKTLPEDFDVCQWEVRIAPPSNDIIWENLSNRNKGIKTLYRFFTWFFLIIISVVLTLPLTFLDKLEPLINFINRYLENDYTTQENFQLYLTPLCLYLTNYILIPTVIIFLLGYEKRSRKSHNAKTKFRKNFFFFIMNQIIVPLAGFKTIKQVYDHFAEVSVAEWPEELSNNVSTSGSFFLRYIIQISLITNTFQLLSLPKLFWDFYSTHTWYLKKIEIKRGDNITEVIERSLYKTLSTKNNLGKRLNSDENADNTAFYFDLAYQQAFSISIFAMVFLFSITNPIILPFGCLFFYLKFCIDKYNIVCIYPLEFHSKGFLRRTICIFMIVSIGIFQISCMGLFISLSDKAFNGAAFIHLILLCVASSFIFSKKPWKPRETKKPDIQLPNLVRMPTRYQYNEKKDDYESVNNSSSDGLGDSDDTRFFDIPRASFGSSSETNPYNILDINLCGSGPIEESKERGFMI